MTLQQVRKRIVFSFCFVLFLFLFSFYLQIGSFSDFIVAGNFLLVVVQCFSSAFIIVNISDQLFERYSGVVVAEADVATKVVVLDNMCSADDGNKPSFFDNSGVFCTNFLILFCINCISSALSRLIHTRIWDLAS